MHVARQARVEKKSVHSAGGGGPHCNASASMKPQHIHDSDDDGHCGSSSASNVDVDNAQTDGGKQQG